MQYEMNSDTAIIATSIDQAKAYWKSHYKSLPDAEKYVGGDDGTRRRKVDQLSFVGMDGTYYRADKIGGSMDGGAFEQYHVQAINCTRVFGTPVCTNFQFVVSM